MAISINFDDDHELSSCNWSDSSTTSCTWSSHETAQIQPELDEETDSSNLSWTPEQVTPKKRPLPTTSLRQSPRVPKVNKKYLDSELIRTPNSQFTTEKWDLFNVMEMNGCGESCTTHLHGLTEYDVLSAHSMFSSKSVVEQRHWLYDYFTNHCPNDDMGSSDFSRLQFILCGKNVCHAVWLATLAISTSRFYEVRRLFVEGMGPPERKKPRSISPKSITAISWMTSYFDKVGDKRPDKDGIYLPTCLTVSAIYSRMKEEIGEETVCFSQFNKIFRNSFPNVTIPKECRFTKCNFCTLVKNEIYKPAITPAEKRKLRSLLDDHLKLQEQERHRYYSNRQQSIDDPDNVLSLIIDGMDQNKTNLPSFVRTTKSCQNLWCLRTHLTGCLVHGYGSFGFFDFLQYSHDTNLTLTCILLTLVEISKLSKVPNRLLIQMDNCVRENKNKYVFGFLAYLVEQQIFSEIELGFLMVGHTHEDIDQSFSCLSRYLRKHDALTMPEMDASMKSSNQKVRSTSTLTYVFDIKNWIAPHLEEIHGHTAPHVFRFQLNRSKKAELRYKNWSHEKWYPTEDKCGLILLKSVPSAEPDLVHPDLNKMDLPRLEQDMPKYCSAGVFHSDAISWWQSFLPSIRHEYGSLPSIRPTWPLQELKSLSASNIQQRGEPSVSHKIVSLHKSQMEARPQIEIGKKSTKSKRNSKASTVCATKSGSASTSELHTELKQLDHGDMLKSVNVDDFIALKVAKYDQELPQIGKVVAIDESTVKIDWLVGSYSGIFSFWKEKGKVIQEIFPLRGIICSIKLSSSMRLAKADCAALKKIYISAEFV